MVNRSLRILVLADSRSFHTIRYVRELRHQGCCVLLASLERGPVSHFRLRTIGPIESLHYAFAKRQVRRVIDRFRPDVINAHFATGYGWLASRAARKGGSPIALHVWGSDILQVPHKSALHRIKARKALESASIVIGDSSYLLGEAAKICALPVSRVIYWGLERQYLMLSDTTRSLAQPLGIIMPRHHEQVYNNDFVLRALAPMLRAGLVTLTVPSWGSLSESFKREAAQLGVDHVYYYERLPRDQFMMVFSQHDVYVSAASSDSSPASLIEACGIGLVPVCADIPGVREWIYDESGFTFEPGNEESLRQSIARLLESTDHLTPLRTRNLERVKREAVFENNVADTISAFGSVAGRSS
jgi:glycosyltransferase involved in cell wall biosynthesis